MRTCNALTRAVLSLVIAACLAVLGGTASADDGATPPRAVPAARSMPRTFGSYDDLIAYASSLAADQAALDQRLLDARARYDTSLSQLIAGTSSGGRGGALFDLDRDRATRADLSALTVKVVTLLRDQRQLLAAGARTATQTAWRLPTEGEITQPFGPTDVWVEPSRTYNGVFYRHFHDGIDIAGLWMADVVAPARGRVAFVGRMMDGAKVVVLVHDAGIVTMYAHLDAASSPPTVAAGDEVAAGQKIGTVGMTGITFGMHLHWAAYRSGQVIDPMSLVGK